MVTNPGTVPLANVVVRTTTGRPGTPRTTSARRSSVATRTATACLDPGETWTYTATGTVGAIGLLQRGTASGTNGTTASRFGRGVLSGAAAAADDRVVKLVNGAGCEHAGVGSGVDAGCAGDVDVRRDEPGHGAVVERDGQSTTTGRGDTADDFSPMFVGGDTNNDGLLDPGETWTYTATGTVGTADYCNVGTACGHERHHRDRHGPGVLSGAAGGGGDRGREVGERPGREHAGDWSGVDAGCAGDVDVRGDEPGHGAACQRDGADDNGTPGNTADDFLRDVHGWGHERRRPAGSG